MPKDDFAYHQQCFSWYAGEEVCFPFYSVGCRAASRTEGIITVFKDAFLSVRGLFHGEKMNKGHVKALSRRDYHAQTYFPRNSR